MIKKRTQAADGIQVDFALLVNAFRLRTAPVWQQYYMNRGCRLMSQAPVE
jgi:hypothetical protein